MPRVRVGRRDILKAGALSLTAAVGCPIKLLAQERSPTKASEFSNPPEVATLYSKEYGRRRIRKIQAALKHASLDALVVSNRGLDYIGYVSNFHPYPLEPGIALLPAEGPSTLFVNTYSSAHARALEHIVWVDEMVDVPHDPVSEGSNQNLVDSCIKKILDQKLERGRIGLAGDEIDWLLPYYLHDKLPQASVQDANRTLTQVIVIKDETELALIRFAQRFIDEIAYPIYRQDLRPGTVDQAVYARVMGEMSEHGASPATVLLFDAGPAGAGTWASGARGRQLQADDIILTEPTPSIAGYQAEKMFTFATGHKIPETQKRGSQIVYEAYQLLMSELKPGQELTPIVQKVDQYLQQHGYQGSTVPIGHWIGTQNHEGPRFTTEGTNGWVLQENMVMSWHPNIVVPGEVRTTCSTCVLITKNGVEDLSKIKMEPIYYVD